MENNKNIPSYSLVIRISPNWDNMYKKICENLSEEDFKNHFQEKIKNINEYELYGSSYEFTEYYDAVSGLTILLQKIERKSGEIKFSNVWEFGEDGCIFKLDTGARISIGESGIQKTQWDEVDRDSYSAVDYLFYFPPVDLIFTFLVILNQKLNISSADEVLSVIKWPDGIENWLKDNGIKYNHPNSINPVPSDWIIDVGKYAGEDFFNEMGKPIVANFTEMGFFSSEMIKEASITMKIFKPNENPNENHRSISYPPDLFQGKAKK